MGFKYVKKTKKKTSKKKDDMIIKYAGIDIMFKAQTPNSNIRYDPEYKPDNNKNNSDSE